MLQSLAGVAGLTVIAWLFGREAPNRAWRVAAVGLAMQFGLALLLLKVPLSQGLFLALNAMVVAMQDATRAGTSFVFGYLGGGPLPFAETVPGGGFVLAFQALPMVLAMSALSALLYHWRVMPIVVNGLSRVLEKSFGIGGAVGVGAAANAFVGMVEAPLLVRPYLARMSRGELFVVMTVGMATIAGTVMVLYATFLTGVVPNAIGHLLTASLISVPAALMVAKLMIPDDTRTKGAPGDSRLYHGALDAVTRGTQDGLSLWLGILAMMIVLIALVHLANAALGLLPALDGAPLSLQRMLSWVMMPLVWLTGLPWAEAEAGAKLMATKTVLNELIAYLDLSRLPPEALSDRSRLIMTYSLCGFANFGSLGILLAGMTAMAPERREDILGLGMPSLVSGTLTTLLTGAVIGVLL
ncbi:MAG: nucleoside:proton symporter [Alphaproteobacteria bacterium]|nr:nucleoside:proton symporter [Alphaproteobacteria bacterium]